jgi:hypothetical protein
MGLSRQQLRQPLGEGDRSFVQDLVHLLNSEARSSEAIYLALLADEPLLVNVHPERQWGKLLRFDQFKFLDLLAYFKLRRRLLLGILESQTESQWGRVVREEGKLRNGSVYWKARSLALHEGELLAYLEGKLDRIRPSVDKT